MEFFFSFNTVFFHNQLEDGRKQIYGPINQVIALNNAKAHRYAGD